MKTSNLIGPALDWAIAKCEDQEVYWCKEDNALYCGDGKGMFPGDHEYNPSTDWEQGGLILERERIQIAWLGDKWEAWIASDDGLSSGPTPLIAVMRCYVASKLGDDVEVPEELTGDPSEPGHPLNPRSTY